MMSLTFKAPRRVGFDTALAHVLPSAHMRMMRELMAAERGSKAKPTANETLCWLRLNMPRAALRLEDLLHPAD